MTQSSNTPYEALEVGQTASYSKSVEERDILLFAAVSGDHNPVHLDAEYAATTMFKERIAHGMFSGALISAAVACTLPGPGTIYVGQQMSFQKPVKLGDTLTVRLEILEKLPKFRVRIATRVFNQHDELVVDGEAEIIAPRKAVTVELATLPPISIG
ncbi:MULTISPECIES: MaoC family dehydratase [Pseudomonadaceae]|uniref:MaoC domain protein dehydratase n=2 Tax=Pseudomonadaceae TaxID=135621 RepID=F6AH07_PSEF1|nr:MULTISPECIES: MaoC family dehydratase [Pseudomonas]AEF21545.1 MaoC domain protein dehydratase [Pseudomonas fulva 12-X]MBV7562017.1 MaoC family dehydratase [Pseudomonas sp. sia0905]MDD1508819.1 MaoC family dehydratase [Pseudomonas sp. CNPSo 3701]PZW64600.1 acyl dehydratase [Pseudomonas sp. URMO17WK12:I1]TWE02257.1 acyl dehydratase [Pseudomonas sp. AG1028]